LDEADLIAAFNGLYNLSLENAARLIAEDTSK
jgi:hypothetical protein